MLKNNSTPHSSHKWKFIIKGFVNGTMNYLEKYYKNSNSELGFGVDKEMLGWNMAQGRHSRISNILLCTNSGTIYSILGDSRMVSHHRYIKSVQY